MISCRLRENIFYTVNEKAGVGRVGAPRGATKDCFLNGGSI